MITHLLVKPDRKSFILIVHAIEKGDRDWRGNPHNYQWYLTDDPESNQAELLKTQVYESVVVGSEDDGFLARHKGKWLRCRVELKTCGYYSPWLYLTNDFMEIISKNQLDTIGFWGADGNSMDAEYFQKQSPDNQT